MCVWDCAHARAHSFLSWRAFWARFSDCSLCTTKSSSTSCFSSIYFWRFVTVYFIYLFLFSFFWHIYIYIKIQLRNRFYFECVRHYLFLCLLRVLLFFAERSAFRCYYCCCCRSSVDVCFQVRFGFYVGNCEDCLNDKLVLTLAKSYTHTFICHCDPFLSTLFLSQ